MLQDTVAMYSNGELHSRLRLLVWLRLVGFYDDDNFCE